MNLRSKGVRLTAAWLLLLASAESHARDREAIQKAVAATVAVEWRADEKSTPSQAEAVRSLLPPRAPDADAQPDDSDSRRAAAALRWTRIASLPKADLTLASGVVVSADGLVVTLNREPDGRLDVTLTDGRSLPARVVVDDHRSGLRLLKVDAADLPHVSLADAEAELWEEVFAAFCTDRQERTALRGMVTMPYQTDKLHLDRAAGAMSGGGAVVNEQGGLVGILLSRSSEGPAQATSSAVRLKDIRALLAARQGENTVVVHRGFLGVQLESKREGGRERVVVRVLPDSPAQSSGMLDGDELVAVAGEKTTSVVEAAAAVARRSPGEKISVLILRDGQEKPFEITVGRPPASFELAQDAREAVRHRVAASVVHPEKLYVLSEDGKSVAVPANSEHVDALRKYARAVRMRASTIVPQQASEPAASTIRVERSDLDKKLEEVGRSVESLQQQVKKLTDEIQALRSKLAEGR